MAPDLISSQCLLGFNERAIKRLYKPYYRIAAWGRHGEATDLIPFDEPREDQCAKFSLDSSDQARAFRQH
jgi:hypothetical protein